MSTATLPKTYRSWVLNEYAKGPINDNTFKLKEMPMPDAANLPANNILVKVQMLGFEPSMRPSVSTDKSYREPHPLGQPMWALGIGEIVASNSSNFAVGSKVYGLLNMQEYTQVDVTQGLVGPYDDKVGVEHIAALSIPGQAAHVGLFHVGQFKKGDVVLVSAAAGATGSSVVQMAKAAGASKIIGLASKAKCDGVVKKGADVCLDYNSSNFAEELKKATGGDVNVYFDNTGGPITDLALTCMARFGRVAVCGAISEYQKLGSDDHDAYHGIKNWRQILMQSLEIKGFTLPHVSNEVKQKATEELKQFVREGKLKSDITTYKDTGVEHCIDAMMGLFSGQNTGKMTLKLSD